MNLSLILVLIATSAIPSSVSARSKSREKLPIREEEVTGLGPGADSRMATISSADGQHSKASECRFSEKRYELEETWHPDLGSPFGIMYCVHCECVPIHKKRRIVGRVRCKNIKTECPKVNCPDPVLLPGRCCKICPGETENPDLTIEVDLKREEEEKNGRHYASLLRPPTGTSGSGSVATGRFFFRKKTLSYSFVTSKEFGLPKLITFLDNEANIIEEFPIQMTSFQNSTGKTCGSWHRLPRRYRRQLRRDEIHAQLTNDDGLTISGRIGKHFGLASELFSGLAISTSGGDEVATAIVSVTSLTGTGSVHVNLLMSGLFNNDNVGSGLAVKFEWNTDNGTTEAIVEDLVIPKINNEMTSIDFKTVFDSPVLESLGRGELLFTLTSKEENGKSVQGFLAPKFSCDLFDSVLSTSQLDGEDPIQSTTSLARGLAWMFMHKTGQIQYHLRVTHLSSDLVSIQIDNGRKSRRLLRVVQELLPTFTYDENVKGVGLRSGWANGTMFLSANDIEDLYHSNLYINVATMQNEREIRGRIITQLLGPAHEFADFPILISGDANRPSTSVNGLAWANVDSTCKLNYYVRLSSADKREESKLSLKDYPMKNLKAMALVPIRTSELQEFYGTEVSGYQDSIHKLSMARLDSGDASFVIQRLGENPFTIEGRIVGVHPHADCLPRFSRNHLELMPGYLSDLGEERPDLGAQYATKCVYEDKAYNNGDQWSATHENCKMCSCIKGNVECEPILCPKTNCTTPLILEGECCPTCQVDILDGEQQACWFEGDKQFHKAGTKWHPYIPPWGFSRCALCTCRADTLQVDCQSKSCPALACPAKQQVRSDTLACCKICDESIPLENEDDEADEEVLSSDPDRPHDMGVEKTDQDVLDSGGCLWRDEVRQNGAVWHPRVVPFGRVSCVACNCKDGQTRCQKQQCQKLTCRYHIKEKEECCPRCAQNSAETKRARKLQRLAKLRKLRRTRRLRQQQEALHEEAGDEEQKDFE